MTTSAISPESTICSFCRDDFSEKQNCCSRLLADRSIAVVSGENHKHLTCLFHQNCLHNWRSHSFTDNEDPRLEHYPYSDICPNDRCKYTHINGKSITRIDMETPVLIATLAIVIIAFILKTLHPASGSG